MGEHRCHARVSHDGITAPVPCPRPVEWAQDLPYDARPEQRWRSYWCDRHVWAHGSDPRRLTTEDLAILRWRRARSERAEEQVRATRARVDMVRQW